MELLLIVFALGTAAGTLLAPLIFVLMDGLVLTLLFIAEVAGITIIIVSGIVLDICYNQLVRAKKKPYRLPWFLRWNGWRIAGASPRSVFRPLYYTPRVRQMSMYSSPLVGGALIPIVRYGR